MTITRRDLLALAAAMPAFRGLANAPLPTRARGALPHDAAPDDEAAWERIGQQFVIEGRTSTPARSARRHCRSSRRRSTTCAPSSG
ncbi:MAG: hypothetical protein IPJ11_08885 [Gemmatimonadetes bacterium]|nr:hypothetical protein [Gemmatimonadota bacterium]